MLPEIILFAQRMDLMSRTELFLVIIYAIKEKVFCNFRGFSALPITLLNKK